MIYKVLFSFFLALIPLISFAADGSLSFTPPAGDYSVVFLSNIFGVVDGVLHGTGSQIMGNMFAVFNAAVLALGGVVIMYTLIVSTMNTAHEGQMLGQKWSSIWIPVRSTLGLALLIPKASGYCLMQIFVMWVVVQGIGAADKLWDAALGYLNRGGVIIQKQVSSGDLVGAGGGANVNLANGARQILEGQVCMLGLQMQLQNQKNALDILTNKNLGPCGEQNPSILCTNQVPDFLNSVNIVETQRKYPDAQVYNIPLPNLDGSSPFALLNGRCGAVVWNRLSGMDGPTKLNSNDIATIKMSRAIALQQMYQDLSEIARTMVNNNPEINVNLKPDMSKQVSAVADQPFGVPKSKDNTDCNDQVSCQLWSGENNRAPLLDGTEFKGALADYTAVMEPTLRLKAQTIFGLTQGRAQSFITEASLEGWIMAGSYFFNVVGLNNVNPAGSAIDTDSGIDKSSFNSSFLSSITDKDCSPPDGKPLDSYLKLMCKDVGGPNALSPILKLITGQDLPNGPINAANTPPSKVYNGALASTVLGYVNNARMLETGSQPPNSVNFYKSVNFSLDQGDYSLPSVDFPCGHVQTFIFDFCLGQIMGTLIYDFVIRILYNIFTFLFHSLVDSFVHALIEIPIAGMAFIFQDGVKKIADPNANPIVALAQMGTYYINFAGNYWLTMFTFMLNPVSFIILPIMMLGTPIIIAWLATMVSIGFVTAYYIPVLPYMIFTFGAIAWLMAVIEAMVAAPIVALGVTHPEGHDAFGKGEQAIMILMNIFLRPAMMIIGYIAAIIISFVGVWVLNAGFDRAIGFMQGSSEYGTTDMNKSMFDYGTSAVIVSNIIGQDLPPVDSPSGAISGGYGGWAGIFAFFFSILIYTTTYITIVQKSFTLIVTLPDKILRWIGGTPEGVGQEVERWTGEVQGKVGEAEKSTSQGMGAVTRQLSGHSEKLLKQARKSVSSTIKQFNS